METIIGSIKNPMVVDADSAKTYLENPATGLIVKLTNEMRDNHIELVNKEWLVNLEQFSLAFTSAYKEISDHNSIILSDICSLNLRDLYNAIIGLNSSTFSEFCPVCMTPMSQVKVNPFIHAREELEKLVVIENAKSVIKENAKIASDNYKLTEMIETF